MDAIGKLTGGIAHDFNNMLNIILGYSSILKRKLNDNPELLKFAEEINNAGNRGAKLTRKLLDFSRDTPKQESSVVNLNNLILESKDMIEKTLTAMIEINFDLEPDLWLTNIDAADMDDAILNLSINAMHAMSGGGNLSFTTTNTTLNDFSSRKLGLPCADYVQLTISDTGTGMDDVVLSQIFEPFFSTKKEMGTGLGLSQVYGFVQRANGSIQVRSIINQGSSFSIYLPRYSGSYQSDSNTDQEEINESHPSTENILIVDDEPALAVLTGEMLKPYGYNIFIANSGVEALQIFREQEIDLMISDVVMPKMDGFTLATQVKQEFPGVLIQMASGYNAITPHNDNKELADNILSKPYTSKELLQRVRDLLGNAKISQASN